MENWYYEYEVLVVEDDEEVLRQGVICAESFKEAAANLEDYYGLTLTRINKLACIVNVLYEFNNPEAEFQVMVRK